MTSHFDHDNKDVYRIEFNHNKEASNKVVSGGIEFSAPPAEYKQNLDEIKKALKPYAGTITISTSPKKLVF
ncbi:hypothetical protein BH11CYA1_BH11CYA1_51240 [soil metagenome]